jgi:hypothetical protein
MSEGAYVKQNAWAVYRRTQSTDGWHLVGVAWTPAAARVIAWDVRRESLTPVDTRIEPLQPLPDAAPLATGARPAGRQ